jgi:hypothetical protein
MTDPSTAGALEIVRDGADASPLLGGLMEYRDIFRERVLKKWLDPTDLALLARACWKCDEAVASAGLARAGDTAEMPFKLVAFLGSGEMLAWAKENGCPWEEDVCAIAAMHGQLEALQRARELDCPWKVMTAHNAALGGHLEVLQWVRAQGCEWNTSTCSDAAAGGHLNVLQWLTEQGCPWNVGTCTSAAKNGHVEVFHWARENGCECHSPDMFRHAAIGGNVELVAWLFEQRLGVSGAFLVDRQKGNCVAGQLSGGTWSC